MARSIFRPRTASAASSGPTRRAARRPRSRSIPAVARFQRISRSSTASCTCKRPTVSQATAGFSSVAKLIAPSFSANTLYFSQTSSGTPGLWKLDATSDTVSFVAAIGALPADFAEAKGKLYFTAADGTQLDQLDPAGA